MAPLRLLSLTTTVGSDCLMQVVHETDLNAYLMRSRQACDTGISALLRTLPEAPGRLLEAMRYSTLLGGKRIRPCLVYAGSDALGGDFDTATAAAVAVEMIHCYSLIHDDLPALDDDDLRRGQPTLHRAFDEATAIIVGDALQGLAFQTLAEHAALSADIRLRMISCLARAAGPQGMIAGQCLDLAAVGHTLSLESLQHMHRLKTGALIQASVELGALSAGCTDTSVVNGLRHYAGCIGLAFQVQDDILDVTGDTSTLGKMSGADMARNKPTYVSLLGLERALAKAAQLVEEAVDTLNQIPGDTQMLAAIARYITTRSH